jgi:hypothetical protein
MEQHPQSLSAANGRMNMTISEIKYMLLGAGIAGILFTGSCMSIEAYYKEESIKAGCASYSKSNGVFKFHKQKER